MVFVNWIWSYWTISTRLPSGSRKSRRRPGQDLDAGWRRGLGGSPLCRRRRARSGGSGRAARGRPCMSARNWSPMSMKAACWECPRSWSSKRRAVELERAFDVADLEGDVVDSDQAWGRCPFRAGSGGGRRTRARGSRARARPGRSARGARRRPRPRAAARCEDSRSCQPVRRPSTRAARARA